VGRLQDLAFDEGADHMQEADSRELQRFTCGHEVVGPPLSTADARALDVERRDSAETVDPPQAQ
jgi:hypothetical protein